MVKFLEGLGEELSLYVRQVAWLQAVPQEEKKQTLGQSDTKTEAKSRLDEFLDAGRLPPLPDNPAPWITETLMEIGPIEAGGVEGAAISWRTLAKWQDQIGVVLEPWQARLLRRLSAAFLAESQRARKKDCPAPWSTATRQARRAIVSDKVDRILDAIAAAPPPKSKSRKSK